MQNNRNPEISATNDSMNNAVTPVATLVNNESFPVDQQAHPIGLAVSESDYLKTSMESSLNTYSARITDQIKHYALHDFSKPGIASDSVKIFYLLQQQGNLEQIHQKLEEALKQQNNFLDILRPPAVDIYMHPHEMCFFPEYAPDLYEKRLTTVLHYYLLINSLLREPSNANKTLDDIVANSYGELYNHSSLARPLSLRNFIFDDFEIPKSLGYVTSNRSGLTKTILSIQSPSLKALLLNIAVDKKSHLYALINSDKPIVDSVQKTVFSVTTFFGEKQYQSYMDQIQEANTAAKRELFSAFQNQGFTAIESVLNTILSQNPPPELT